MRNARAQLLLLFVGAVVAATLVPPAGRASGGRYTFAGGTPRQQDEVVRALEVSSFDWNLVPAKITIHIRREVVSSATPGHIWLDADLLDSGPFAWGVVQHEYAHQVDFCLLNTRDRALLSRRFGVTDWCGEEAVRRDRLGCERFASELAWAYWPSAENCMRPSGAPPASGRDFRHLVSTLISYTQTGGL